MRRSGPRALLDSAEAFDEFVEIDTSVSAATGLRFKERGPSSSTGVGATRDASLIAAMPPVEHRYNENIQALEVDPDFIAEGIAHAMTQGCDAIRIYDLNYRDSGTPVDLDLSPFAGNGTIRSVLISDSVKAGNVSLDGLYDMTALRALSWEDKKIRPDLARLPGLEELHGHWSKGLAGFDHLKKLKHLFLRSLNEKDCRFAQGLASLEVLRLTGGSVESLHGIEGLAHLQLVRLGHCASLKDATALAKLTSLVELSSEKCKYLRDFSFLAGAPRLEKLFVSELDSLAFVPTLKHLTFLKFWDLADGNVAPALDAPALEKVDLYPDRKHYTHTKAEVNAVLGARG